MSGWQQIVEEIRADNRSGATALLGRAAEAILLAVEDLGRGGAGGWRDFDAAVRAVASARPALGGLCRLAGAALFAADGAPGPEVAARQVDAAVRAFAQRVNDEAPRIVRRAGRLIRRDDVVVTISASSLVERALLATAPREIVCLESRPAREGVALARRLAAAGRNVTLAVDAAGPSQVAGADLVLLGGDTLAPDGLVHKIGTLGLALAARQHGVATYALCGSEKWLPSRLVGALTEGGRPSEVVTDPPAGLAVATAYFDCTSLDLLSGVVGAAGILTFADVRRQTGDVRVHPRLASLLETH
ncbi:MAG: hypothetical protein IT305_22470 [Chloroflexi bacterium]|nr:hypothetical protein [Chloroflexota bacterium]